MRVVFDTNIFVSVFAIPGGQAEKAIRRIIDGTDRLFLSKPILMELLRILADKFSHDPEQLSRVAVYLGDLAEMVAPKERCNVLADEADNRILGMRLGGECRLHCYRRQSNASAW